MFDKSLFLNNTNPWPNQVFSKDFDCYFFVNYPHQAWQAPGHCRPYDLSNNLGERTVYITNPEGTSSMNFTYKDFNFDEYNQQFESKIQEDRFLFWSGEAEEWAMVSDKKYGVAVYGIQCKWAHNIPMFFEKDLLSPIQFLQKVAMEKHLDIFLKNYRPSKKMTEGDEENPLWVKHYFQCKVESENDKIFYWPAFEKLYHCIAKLLSHYQAIDLYASQAFERRYWMNDQWYGSAKNAPVGGFQKFSIKNCEKVATKFLNDNEHLKSKFNLQKEEAEKLYVANKKGLIEFFGFNIYGHTIKQKTKGHYTDFFIVMGLYDHGDKSDEYNQNFQMAYKKSTIEEEKITNALQELKDLSFAINVAKHEQPSTFAKYTRDKPLEIIGIYNVIPEGVTELIMKHVLS